MNKLKINDGLAAVILLGGFVSGWSTLLVVVILMLIFCDINDFIKKLMIRVISFYLGITLFNTAWGLIVDGVELGIESFEGLISVINSYLTDPIELYKLELYLLSPISKIVTLLDNIVSYFITFVKFSFIIAILANNNIKDNFIISKINVFVDKVVSFINGIEFMKNNNQQQNVQSSVFVNSQNNGF